MRFLGRLLAFTLPVVVGRGLVAWYLLRAAFPLARAQQTALQTTLLAATAVELVLVAAALAWLARPIDALLAREGEPEEAAAAAAAAAAHRLSINAAALVGAPALAAGAAIVLALRQRGLAADLAVAAAAVALAVGILGAMVAYSLAAAAGSAAVERLGARSDVSARGTVRGKILTVGFGLNTIGVLLFASTGYVRYRADFDREYLAAAVRAQEATLASAPAAPGEELAEHVWLVTGAPSALLGPEGAVVARFGPGPAPFHLARGASAGVTALEAGWLVTVRAPGGGVLATWLPEDPLRARRRDFLDALVTMALVVYAATALLAWVAARAITAPFRSLGRAADRIASGDLTASPAAASRDELGQLAGDFRRMAQGLKGLVAEVQGATTSVSLGAGEAAAIGERVRAGAVDEHAGVVAVQAAVEAMEGSMLQVSRGVDGLSEYVAATNRAMGETAAAFEEVSRKGTELERAMAAAVSDVDRLGEAGRDAQARLGRLEALAGSAGGTLSALKDSLSTLERAASESETTAEHVAEMADRAGGVVEETVQGIESLRAAVADAHRRVAALGRRSDDVDQVVDFISEVAGRTNLLSLNASIIAARAGEHGKPFGVVADQIRELAAQIARSTKSIADIIGTVRDDVEGTAALIERGDALAGEGVQLARNSLEALARIRRSTVHARDTAVAIRMAVDAHARSSGEVSRLVESVAEGSRSVGTAVQLVGRSVSAVNTVSRGVDAMADQVARALQDQAGLGRRQTESVGKLEQMITDIGRAVDAHDAATRRVREELQRLSETAGRNEAAVEGLAAVAERLGAGARALGERVGRFRVS
jgi:methyl-accepting chemotaxis protein